MLGVRSTPGALDAPTNGEREEQPPHRSVRAARADALGRVVDKLLDPGRLQARFGFTPAEARVAVALAAGESRGDMAQRFGVQLNTVHAHLKQALAKTGCRRQTQLVALVWRSGIDACIKASGAATNEPTAPDWQ